LVLPIAHLFSFTIKSPFDVSKDENAGPKTLLLAFSLILHTPLTDWAYTTKSDKLLTFEVTKQKNSYEVVIKNLIVCLLL
jgi:hypothetical protein